MSWLKKSWISKQLLAHVLKNRRSKNIWKFLRKSLLRFSLLRREIIHNRSSRPEVFCEKSALRNFAKFAGKQLCQSLFFNKVATLLKARLCHSCFSMNLAKLLRRPSFTHRTPPAAASEIKTTFNRNNFSLYSFSENFLNFSQNTETSTSARLFLFSKLLNQ